MQPASIAYPGAFQKLREKYAKVTDFGRADGLCTFDLNTPERCYDCNAPAEVSVQVGYRLGGDTTPFHGPEYAYLCRSCAEERERLLGAD